MSTNSKQQKGKSGKRPARLLLALALVLCLLLAACQKDATPAGSDAEGKAAAGSASESSATQPSESASSAEADEPPSSSGGADHPTSPSGEEDSAEPSSSSEKTDTPTDQQGEASSESGEETLTPEEPDEVDVLLSEMTLEEKVAQLFVVMPESLVPEVNPVTAAGDATRQAFDGIPVGGVIYMGPNIQTPDQTREMLANMQAISKERVGLPAFLCVDEEGGEVARVAENPAFDVPHYNNARYIGDTGDSSQAYEEGKGIGYYLRDLGFNVDFAPVADVLSNPNNVVIGTRSFGSDAEIVTQMAEAMADGLTSQGVIPAYKHFPGHGATEGDTHEGYAYTDKSLDELMACELVPFADCVKKGAPMIMVSHISLPQVDPTNTPASLSPIIVNGILREQLGYDGLVITDALNMGAVSQNYTPLDAVKKAIEAGADLLLAPADLANTYQGLLAAVRSGEIPEERIEQSLRRILKVKLAMSEATQSEVNT